MVMVATKAGMWSVIMLDEVVLIYHAYQVGWEEDLKVKFLE